MANRRLGILGCTLVALCGIIQVRPEPVSAQSLFDKAASEEARVMSVKDRQHMDGIDAVIFKYQVISDKDLDWYLHFMRSKPVDPIRVTQGLLTVEVLSRLTDLNSWPPSQERTSLKAVFPLLCSSDFNVRTVAAIMMRKLHDRRVLPRLSE